MQFQGKLINQTSENKKKLIHDPILARLAQICPPLSQQILFHRFYTF